MSFREGSDLRNIAAGAAFLVITLVLAAEDSVRIFVYADWDSAQKSYVPVYLDGVLIAEIKRGKFFAINVSPRQHILIAGEGVPEPVTAKKVRKFSFGWNSTSH